MHADGNSIHHPTTEAAACGGAGHAQAQEHAAGFASASHDQPPPQPPVCQQPFRSQQAVEGARGCLVDQDVEVEEPESGPDAGEIDMDDDSEYSESADAELLGLRRSSGGGRGGEDATGGTIGGAMRSSGSTGGSPGGSGTIFGVRRYSSKQAIKVEFEPSTGIKLADGRIYVPLPFVHHNFEGREFPLFINADIYVNDQLIKAGFEVGHGRAMSIGMAAMHLT